MVSETWGVWADPDCVLIRTPGFALVFERAGGRFLAALARIEAGDETLAFDTRALALFDPVRGLAAIKARDSGVGDEAVIDNDIRRELVLARTELIVAATAGGLALGNAGRVVERLAGDRLETFLPSGRAATLDRLEHITPTSPRPGAPARGDDTGRRLQAWALGTGLYRNTEGTFRSLTIGTNRFSFSFSYGVSGEEDIIHCRAARVRATDAGAAFAPLFRLATRSAGAAQDIRAEGAADLAFPGPPTGTWRVTEVAPDGIGLENAAGGSYILARPTPGNPALLEWFEYRDYDSAAVRPQ